VKIAIGGCVVVLALASCARRDKSEAVDALHRDIVHITQQIADMRVELKAVREKCDALAKENSALRDRVHQIELDELTAPSPAGATAAASPSAPITLAEPASPRPRGYTQLAEAHDPSVPAPPPVTTPVTNANAPIVRTIGASTQTSSITSDQAIVPRCAQEWKTDYSMIAYCQKKQQDAKDKLDRGNVYGVSGECSPTPQLLRRSTTARTVACDNRATWSFPAQVRACRTPAAILALARPKLAARHGVTCLLRDLSRP
jgi:hypothetical protein